MTQIFRLPCPPLAKRFVLKSSFNSLYDPFGSPCRGQKPSLPLKKAPPLTPPSLLRSEGENRPTRCSNRYAIRLADHQRSRQVMRNGTARGGMAICESLSPDGKLYSGCSCRYFSIQGFNSGISHSIVSQRLSGSTV